METQQRDKASQGHIILTFCQFARGIFPCCSLSHAVCVIEADIRNREREKQIRSVDVGGGEKE